MIAEAGQLALILALALALLQGTLPIIGAARGNVRWMRLARPTALGQFVFIAFAFGCLTYTFVVNDFSVAYTAATSNSGLPLYYRLAAVWGGHEGSLLLWMLMLSGWGVAVAAASRRLPEALMARVLGVMGLVAVGFLAFTLFTSNPFDRLYPIPADGRDLNPLLQDAGMIFHPPLLYMGYVGFSVAFSFALAALIDGKLDAAWARWARPWTTMAWVFLTCGIALGSFWAYYELGWGGWWFWDPVENASFMPWLVGTALVHSLAVTEQRGAFKTWTVLLAIVAFSLSLLGTFLVRSGVLTSVHAFATDPTRGLFILSYLVIVIGGSLAVFAWRAPKLTRGGAFELVSRESFLLANNALFTAAAGAVMLGTLYPLVLDALGAGKISVGPPYFDTVFMPLMVPVLVLIGFGQLARWKRSDGAELLRPLKWAPLVAIVLGLALPFLYGRWSALVALGLALSVWILASSAVTLMERLRGVARAHWWRSLPRGFVGMLVAHVGIAVFVAGVAVSKGYEQQVELKMNEGQIGHLAGYTFMLARLDEVRGPNYTAARATVEVTRKDRRVVTLYPEKRLYHVQKMPMTEAAFDGGVFRHLYVSLGEPLEGNAWLVVFHHKPLVGWIWFGCLLMAGGGILAASDRRYRLASRAAAATGAQPAVA
jgi:cytochrome c-type biogenesis protein CcmF